MDRLLVSPLRRARSVGERAVVALATRSGALTASAVALGLFGSSTMTYMGGGTQTAWPHLFYVPVVAAAHRFRHAGALGAAVVAGLLAGPLMPLDAEAGISQSVSGWLVRLVFFVLTGQIVALLSHGSLESLSQAVADRGVKADLQRALQRDELRVVYQPFVELATGRTVGFEALVRWEHPERGTVAPLDFIPAAERTGAIVPIGLFVLRAAAEQLVTWRSAPGRADLKMAVNLSARQLEDDGLVADVASVLRNTGLPFGSLQLEVTETAVITDWRLAKTRLDDLRRLGITVAIDDFGAGHSSLTYLHRFEAGIIKIDRSFVAALEHDKHARGVAEAIVGLAANMGATTVAEGIETEGQADILRGVGCEIGQGFYYARPLSPEQITIAATPASSIQVA